MDLRYTDRDHLLSPLFICPRHRLCDTGEGLVAVGQQGVGDKMPAKQQAQYIEEDEEVYEEYEGEEDEDDYDGKVEEVDDEDEEGAGQQGAAGQAGEEDEEEEEEEEEEDVAQPWVGLSKLEEREDVRACLAELQAAGLKQLNVLLLGKGGVGKSSTVNSMLGEAAARVQAFKLQAETDVVTPFVRQVMDGDAAGFKVKLIDTIGLEDQESGDSVNYAALQKIADKIKGQPIDVVLFLDRLDLYRVDPLDRSIIQAATDVFGRSIWKKAAIVLTHGHLPQTPPGTDYDSFADRRIKAIRSAIRGRNPLFRPRLPAVLVENNSSICQKDRDGKRLLPDGTQWLVCLLDAISEVTLASRPYRYHPRLTRKPNQQFKWLMPFVLAGQYYLFKEVLQPILDRDLKRQQDADERVWSVKAAQRQRLGIGPPLKPTKEAAWRLEQIYDDD